MTALVILTFVICSIASIITGHPEGAFLFIVCAILIDWALKHIDTSLPHDYFDALDEINTQDADLERED
jgi:hypothetical protein